MDLSMVGEGDGRMEGQAGRRNGQDKTRQTGGSDEEGRWCCSPLETLESGRETGAVPPAIAKVQTGTKVRYLTLP